MSANEFMSTNNSPATSEAPDSAQKRARLEDTVRKSWSLTDRRTDQEVLEEMGLGILDPDDSDNSNETDVTTVQSKSGSKRKHNIENVNPNVRSPKLSPKCGHEHVRSPNPLHGKIGSPRSVERSPCKPLQPSDQNQLPSELVLHQPSVLDEETPIPLLPIDPNYLKNVKDSAVYPSSAHKHSDEEPSTSKMVTGSPVTPVARSKQSCIQSSCSSGFEDLSDEMVLDIFKWLPKGTLVHCMLVCKRWHRVATDETFWQRLELGNRSLTKNALGKILSRKPLVMRLGGSTIADWTDTANFCGQARLQYLDLSMCTIALETLNFLLERCSNLKKLSLENLTVDTDTCRHIGNITRLETLNLTMANGFTAEGVARILEGCIGLQSLNMSWCKLCAECLQQLVSVCPQKLQRLNVSGARPMTDDLVSKLAERCPRLQELDLSDCPRLTSGCVASLGALTRLEHLALSRCYLLQPDHLATLNQMPSLQFLDVFGMMADPTVVALRARMPAVQINQFMLSAIARPTVGSRRTSIWGLRTRD